MIWSFYHTAGQICNCFSSPAFASPLPTGLFYYAVLPLLLIKPLSAWISLLSYIHFLSFEKILIDGVLFQGIYFIHTYEQHGWFLELILTFSRGQQKQWHCRRVCILIWTNANERILFCNATPWTYHINTFSCLSRPWTPTVFSQVYAGWKKLAAIQCCWEFCDLVITYHPLTFYNLLTWHPGGISTQTNVHTFSQHQIVAHD